MFEEEKAVIMHKISFYQTHLTEGQWSYINKVFFENDCRYRKYSLRSIFEAVLYLLVSGCQWRMLPHELPKWQTAYLYLHKWRTSRGLLPGEKIKIFSLKGEQKIER